MTRISVVIPTYNRCDTLKKALAAYLKQTALHSVGEILVVDDGSTDSTARVVDLMSRGSCVPIRYFQQNNMGPAAARNVGIRQATSELILFTDDDIVPQSDLVAEHLEWHRRFPADETAVLGYVTWAPEVNPTPFMRWYGVEALFSYACFASRTELDYRYFYSCNVSLKLDFLRRNGTFDEDFKIAAYEDIELGYRLQKAKMRLLYNSRALAYHQQYVSFDAACRRADKTAAAFEVLRKKEAGHNLPKASRLRRLTKPVAWLLSPLRPSMDWRVSLPRYVYRLMFRVYRTSSL